MSPRLIISRVLLLAIYAVGLTLVWPWVGESYSRAFRASAMTMCGVLSSAWDVKLEPFESPHPAQDTTLDLKNRENNLAVGQQISIRYIGYAPTSFMVALILATPLPWKRRAAALVWASVLMHVWIALSMIVLIVHGYSGDHVVAIYHFSPFWHKAFSFLRETMVKAPVTKYTVPAVIWILVTFRRSDWMLFLGAVGAKNVASDAVTSGASTKRSSR